MKVFKSFAVLSFVALASSTALGSSDFVDSADFPSLQSYFAIKNVSAVLVPANDTRDNLIFLIADRRKQLLATFPSPDASSSEATYATYGEGSVCVSDDAGRSGFIDAVAADVSIPDAEKKLLQDARAALRCSGNDDAANAIVGPVDVHSAAGLEFAQYLAAITLFYKVTHNDMTAFQPLSNASQPWVREAARYMVARVTLLAAQAVAFDDWGTLDRTKVDASVVLAARNALHDYLKDYPQGVYARSAAGLLRRAYWLAGDDAALAADYSKLLLEADVGPGTANLANELDLKLSDEAYLSSGADAALVAVQLLRMMRPKKDDQDKPLPGIAADVIEAQRTHFAGQEDLFDYVRAARAWHVDKDAATVLKLLPSRTLTADLGYVEFSRFVLRAQALASTGDGKAREALVTLFPYAKKNYQRATLELELAKYDERHKNISAVFEKGSLIQDADMRLRVLDYVAGPILLKQQSVATDIPQKERQAALYRLLARDLKHGRFKGFVEDIKLLPPPEESTDGDSGDKFAVFRSNENDTGFECPDLVSTASILAKSPKDVAARLCLGDYFRAHSYDLGLSEIGKDELGGTGTVFAGKELPRQDFYIDIMKSQAATRDQRAYAVYRAIHCYAPVGINDCGGEDVDKGQRKKWFQELKTKYGDTRWAKQQDVYW